MADDTKAAATSAQNVAKFEDDNFRADFKSISEWSVTREVVDTDTGEATKVKIPMIRIFLGRTFDAVDKNGNLIKCDYFDVTHSGFIRQLCQANADIAMVVERTKTKNVANLAAAKAAEDAQDTEFVPTEVVSYIHVIKNAIVGSKFDIARRAVAKDTEFVNFNGDTQKASRDQFFTTIVGIELAPAVVAVFERIRLAELEAAFV